MTEESADVVSWRRQSDGVVVVTLRCPPANTLNLPALSGLHAAIDAAEQAGDVKAMVLASGIDRFFSAGADIKYMSTMDRSEFGRYATQMRDLNDRLAASPWMSIAAMDGIALGGGLELALACTMRVSGPRGSFGLPESRMGLIPAAGGTQRLPALIGRGRALDIMLTARHVPAREAFAMGLVNRLVDGNPVVAALELARQFATSSLPALLTVVRTVDVAIGGPTPQGLAFEADQGRSLLEHGEAAEGISAFLDRRPPNFG